MWIRVVRPLQSRKVRVALTTVIVAYAAEYGLNVSTELLMAIIAMGATIVLGIAHEDNGVKQYMGKAPAEPKPK